MATSAHFLVIDGYNKAGRDELAAGGASVASDLYAAMFKRLMPDVRCDILFPADPDADLPRGTALADYDGITWTGSSLTAYHDVPEVRAQIDFARAVFEAGVPSFGSCWATQIAVVAAGGGVAANPNGREMGIARKITLTPEGRDHPMYRGKPSVFDAFISHIDEVTQLCPGAVQLASNNFTNVQSVAVTYKNGTFWAPQYHPEYDLHEMARLTCCRIDKLVELGFFKNPEAAREYVDLLETLHGDPGRTDIAWLLGVDSDVMDTDLRTLEVRNWIEHQVRPAMAHRR